ncbi:MAG: xanthine dehydrogenase small subunit [Gammaproteobacteria bacterium]|nr:xanthine dehydrogenase small subunit [Gammaproteobacteria bacterium]MDH3468811.1 xanthine dehydrogenase small subunit [Gammaproteobacteria bacterium]
MISQSSISAVRFLMDGEEIALSDVDPSRTVLQLLREDLRRTGTKEGCAEGDCGACTVVLAELAETGRSLRYRAVNSCIQFVPVLDGKALITVESLAAADGQLHPVQRAMVECHGSQCGFCTPGFVMSLFALYKSNSNPSRSDIDDALAGNLCRCTGYRPIVEAAEKMSSLGADNDRYTDDDRLIKSLRTLRRQQPLMLERDGARYFSPTRLDELLTLLQQYSDAYILAGGTDIGLWVTKQHRDLETLIYVGNVEELRRVDVTASHIDIGAAVSVTDAVPVLTEHYPELDELFLRFASPPIRNAATLGGNIANGSPIGDSMPVLIALGTSVVLHGRNGTRELALEDFYLSYQSTARRSDEVVTLIRIPMPEPDTHVRSYKISKRFDQDISAVCGAYRLQLEGGKVREIRVAYGGVAATPKRANACEQMLVGRDWSESSVQAAMGAMENDYTPIGDMRASAKYRLSVSKNLLYRFYLESTGHANVDSLYRYGRQDGR